MAKQAGWGKKDRKKHKKRKFENAFVLFLSQGRKNQYPCTSIVNPYPCSSKLPEWSNKSRGNFFLPKKFYYWADRQTGRPTDTKEGRWQKIKANDAILLTPDYFHHNLRVKCSLWKYVTNIYLDFFLFKFRLLSLGEEEYSFPHTGKGWWSEIPSWKANNEMRIPKILFPNIYFPIDLNFKNFFLSLPFLLLLLRLPSFESLLEKSFSLHSEALHIRYSPAIQP